MINRTDRVLVTFYPFQLARHTPMTHNSNMVVFVETSLFTKLIYEYLEDDEYSELQQYLMAYPEAGAIIKGSGGIRKIRWTLSGKEMRGGIRVIYYWAKPPQQIYLLTLYSKNEQETIDAKTLAKIAKQLEEME